MTKTIAKTYDIANENRARITAAFLAVCAFLSILYIFKVYSVISKTVALQQAEKQVSDLTSSVSGLDSAYLDSVEKVTPGALASYGLMSGYVATYIDRQAPTASLGGLARAGHEL